MQTAIDKFERFLAENSAYFRTTDVPFLEEKISEEKWSKKEILGHLVDSSIHNLIRFTEINYAEKPYIYRTYNQNDLVKINQYQEMDIEELVQFWLSINKQILRLFKSANEEALQYEILLKDNSIINLRYLMTDFVEHLEHHINQIKKTE